MKQRYLILTALFTALFLSGCVNCFYPPRTSEEILINPSLNNREVLNTARSILNEYFHPEDKQKKREITSNWRSADITQFDIRNGIIKINDYSVQNNTIGYRGRIKRITADKLKITVKGSGPYCTDMQDTAEAHKIAQILAEAFNSDTPDLTHRPNSYGWQLQNKRLKRLNP